ncbi:acetoin utilization AcuB family protein [Alteribacillus sp. HJP-4]|uniref:acetoin utilization AcuB family protein n=1 Tax=Alteribacillus sp. HJP-4 TaxID=2775394 RepID=UPI0035CCD4A0
MLVEEIMQKNVITVSNSTSIKEAMALLHKHRIRHIPVIEQDQTITGIISDRDIRDASPSIFHADYHTDDLERPVSSIMKYPVITAHPLDFIEEAAVVLYENEISALPVADEHDKLIGMLTESNVLHTLVKLTGAHQPSSRMEIKVPNIAGQLAEVSTILKDNKVNVTSVLIYPHKNAEYKILTFRVQMMDPRVPIEKLRAQGYEVMWPRIPGMSR